MGKQNTKKSKKENQEEQINPTFVPGYSEVSPRVYSNHVAVRTTGIDFTLYFMDIVPPTKEQVKKAEKAEPIEVPLQCEVVVPNDIIPSLIRALKAQYAKHNSKKTSKDK